MKPRNTARRQLLVLTPEEKRTVSFILVALLLGIGAKHYRDRHAVPPRQTAIVDTAKTVSLPAQKRAEAKRRKLAK
ncbi:MAG TPA: hypothetical protein VGW57_14080 [Chthoniobacterales bacterium]|nr:hypothetical protein [Chthoniobacterales bacterium]